MLEGSYLNYKLGQAPDPFAELERLKEETLNILDYASDDVATGAGLSFLLFLSNCNNHKRLPLATAFDEVSRQLIFRIYHMHAKVSMNEFAYPACCMGCTVQSPIEEDPEDPDEWPPFMAVEEYDEGLSDQGIDFSNLDELKQLVVEAAAAATSSPSDILPAVQLFISIRDNISDIPLQNRFRTGNLADDLTEAIRKGLSQDLFEIQRRCPAVPYPVEEKAEPGEATSWVAEAKAIWSYPDFENWSNWTPADWIRFESWKRKVLAAGCDLGTMGCVINALENIRDHIGELGLAYQVPVAMWATELGDRLCGTLERALAEITSRNIGTRQGREVMKKMLEPDHDSGEALPD